MTALRGLVRPGNSGGPVVDGDGRVVTTVFAATTRGPRGGYGVPNAVVRRALARPRAVRCRTGPVRRLSRYPAARHGQDARHRREAVRRARPVARPPRRVPEARGLPRVRRPRHDVGGRPPRPARRARRVRPEVQEVAHGRPADRARPLQARRARRALQEADERHHQAAQARRRRPGRQRLRRRPRGRADLRLDVREGGREEARRAAVAVLDDHGGDQAGARPTCARARTSRGWRRRRGRAPRPTGSSA